MDTVKINLWMSAAVLFLTTGIVMADSFGELLEQARAAEAQGNIAKARRLLIDAGATLAPSKPMTAPVPDRATTATAPKSGKKKEKEKTAFERLSDKGYRLRLGPGPGGPGAAPATFAFDKNLKENTDTTFSAAFLLGYNPFSRKIEYIDPATGEKKTVRHGSDSLFGKRNLTWVWDASVQGNLTTDSEAKADSWTFRLGGSINHTNPASHLRMPEYAMLLEQLFEAGYDDRAAVEEVRRRYSDENAPLYTASWWSFSGKLEADKDFDNQRASFEVMMTPTTSLPGNGKFWPSHANSENAPMRFIWRPFFGIDAGGQIASDGTIDEIDDTLRGIFRFTGTLSFDFLARALGIPAVSLSVDNTTYYLTDSGNGYNYLNSQLAFSFTDHVGFSLTYVNGENAPNFERVENFGGAFAVKF